MTQLHHHGLVSYKTFAHKLDQLAQSKGFTLLSSPPQPQQTEDHITSARSSPTPYTVPDSPTETDNFIDKLDPVGSAESVVPAAAPTRAPAILAPLRDSLHQLSNQLQSPPLANLSARSASTNPSSASLSTALSTLSSFISTQNSVASSMAYRPYIGYTSTGTPTVGQGLSQGQLELKEVVTSLKAEIRTVKGALLNRRNFAALPGREEGVAA